MQHLSWTGTLGVYLNPLFLTALVCFLTLALAAVARGFSPRSDGPHLINPTPPSVSLIGPSLVIGLALWLLSLAGVSLLAPLALGNIWMSLILCLILGAVAGFGLFQISAEMIFKLVWLAFYATDLVWSILGHRSVRKTRNHGHRWRHFATSHSHMDRPRGDICPVDPLQTQVGPIWQTV